MPSHAQKRGRVVRHRLFSSRNHPVNALEVSCSSSSPRPRLVLQRFSTSSRAVVSKQHHPNVSFRAKTRRDVVVIAFIFLRCFSTSRTNLSTRSPGFLPFVFLLLLPGVVLVVVFGSRFFRAERKRTPPKQRTADMMYDVKI